MKLWWSVIVLALSYSPVASAFQVDFEAVRIGAPLSSIPVAYPEVDSVAGPDGTSIESAAPYGNLYGNVLETLDAGVGDYIGILFVEPHKRFIFDFAHFGDTTNSFRDRLVVTCLLKGQFVFDWGFNFPAPPPNSFSEGTVDFDVDVLFPHGVECDEVRVSAKGFLPPDPFAPALGDLAIDCLRVDEGSSSCGFDVLIASWVDRELVLLREAKTLIKMHARIQKHIDGGRVWPAIGNTVRMIGYTNLRRGRGIADEAADQIVAFSIDLIIEFLQGLRGGGYGR